VPGGLDEEVIEQAAGALEHLGDSAYNRIFILYGLYRGLNWRELERELIREPNKVMIKRTLNRNLEKLTEAGFVKELQDNEHEITPPGELLMNTVIDSLRQFSSAYEGGVRHAKIMSDPTARNWGEKFYKRFENANITAGRPDAEEAYNNRIHQTTFEGDELLPKNERIGRVREITHGVVSAGNPRIGYSEYHDPIVQGDLDCEFIHSPELAKRLKRREEWRAEAYEHQQHGTQYFHLDESISYTMTIFDSERVGIFLPKGDEPLFIESQEGGAIDWATTKFKRLKEASEATEYESP
jgi:DNA-binding HxlR family transcriptional regulator